MGNYREQQHDSDEVDSVSHTHDSLDKKIGESELHLVFGLCGIDDNWAVQETKVKAFMEAFENVRTNGRHYLRRNVHLRMIDWKTYLPPKLRNDLNSKGEAPASLEGINRGLLLLMDSRLCGELKKIVLDHANTAFNKLKSVAKHVHVSFIAEGFGGLILHECLRPGDDKVTFEFPINAIFFLGVDFSQLAFFRDNSRITPPDRFGVCNRVVNVRHAEDTNAAGIESLILNYPLLPPIQIPAFQRLQKKHEKQFSFTSFFLLFSCTERESFKDDASRYDFLLESNRNENSSPDLRYWGSQSLVSFIACLLNHLK
eukprot:TRINITY_DN8902_c0_g1_i1.p1 TRINITY_DN8902_c0_g1~~TRINITY_DN8902_c0_g1_i1.p1  ORF type:complete len:314 (-),score=33.57 TRINITY_DN8902_c0_g1_i1:47-988(-)